jgi:5-(carboxyamino)imidazole ribonucleotide mutase
MPEVIIILGSPADAAWGQRIGDALDRLGVPWETRVCSAHKTPARALAMLADYEEQSRPRVYITVAGRSNALSGFVDAAIGAPVIACPPASDAFGGMDLLSSLRMPRGVAPLVALEPENAALAAAKILSLASPDIRTRVLEAQEAERRRVEDADAEMRSRLLVEEHR